MGDVDRLEVVAEEGQGGESLVGKAPVGQHALQRGEDVERALMRIAADIGGEECGYHHIAGIEAYGAVFGIELAAHTRARRVVYIGVLGFDALLIDTEIVAELVEGLAAVAVVGIAHTAKCRADGDGGHVERTRLGGGIACIHILYALALVAGARHGEVYLQVGEGLERGFYLQVFRGARGGRRGHAVGTQQPTVILGLCYVGVANHTEGVFQSWTEHATALALSEHVAGIGQEAGQGEVVGIAVGDTDIAYHHGKACGRLYEGVPLLFLKFGLGHHIDTDAQGVLVLDEQFVGIEFLVLEFVGFALGYARLLTGLG